MKTKSTSGLKVERCLCIIMYWASNIYVFKQRTGSAIILLVAHVAPLNVVFNVVCVYALCMCNSDHIRKVVQSVGHIPEMLRTP